MPDLIKWTPWVILLIVFAVWMCWRFFRRFRQSGDNKQLMLAQICAFPAAFLAVSLLEARGLLPEKAADFIYVAAAAAILAFGLALRNQPERKKRTERPAPAKKRKAAAPVKTAGKREKPKKPAGRKTSATTKRRDK